MVFHGTLFPLTELSSVTDHISRAIRQFVTDVHASQAQPVSVCKQSTQMLQAA